MLTKFLWTSRKRGITLPYKGRPKKKIRVRLFFVLMLYIKFKFPRSSGSLVLQPTKGITGRRTDGQMERRSDRQMDRPKPICPLNFFEVGSIKKFFFFLFFFFFFLGGGGGGEGGVGRGGARESELFYKACKSEKKIFFFSFFGGLGGGGKGG